MVMPSLTNNKEKIYLVSFSSGSPYRGSGIDLDEYVRKFTYDLPKDKRRQIGAIRQRINEIKSWGCSRLYGAYFTNETGKQQIIDRCAQADRDMKEIDPRLYCTVNFIKQDFSDNENLTALDQLQQSIRKEVLGSVLERINQEIEKNKDHLTEKTRLSLHAMVNKMGALNITRNATIEEDLRNIREKIDANKLRELRDEILIISDENRNRSASLEIVDDIRIKKEPEKEKVLLPESGTKRVLDIL